MNLVYIDESGNTGLNLNDVQQPIFIMAGLSFGLQLVDLVAYYIRKYEENELGHRVSEIDKQTFGTVRGLISTGIGSNIVDVIEWVKGHYLK